MYPISLNRIYMRIFAPPLLLTAYGFFFDWLLSSGAESFAQSVYLRGLAQPMANIGYYGSGMLMLISAVLTVVAYARLWRWENGHADCCYHCGGPMSFVDRCLNCRRKRRYG